jgi:hypothetical protein
MLMLERIMTYIVDATLLRHRLDARTRDIYDGIVDSRVVVGLGKTHIGQPNPSHWCQSGFIMYVLN